MFTGAHGYYRHPCLHENSLVFTSEDDLWLAPLPTATSGSASDLITAERLTAAAARGAICLHPALSPDGRWVAFTSSLGGGGGHDVWIAPTSGGRAERLTYEAVPPADGSRSSVVVCGWSADGAAVLYSTPSFSPLDDPQLVLVDAFGARRGEAEVLPLASACDGVLARCRGEPADTLFFVRLPFHGSECRGYQGGFVQQLWRWRVDGGAGEAVPLTGGFKGTSLCPMWDEQAQRLAFLSDRSGAIEVWSCTADGFGLTQHSSFGSLGLDARAASLSRGTVAVEASAELYLVSLSSAAGSAVDVSDKGGQGAPPPTHAPLPIRLRSAREALSLPLMLSKPLDDMTHYAIAPKGDRAALTIRGRVYVVPVQGAASNGVCQSKVGRVVDASRNMRGLRVRCAEYAWGDEGIGNWLCLIGSQDGMSVDAVRAQSEGFTFETRLDSRDGCTAVTLSNGGPGDARVVFSEVEPGGLAARAGIQRGDGLLTVDGVVRSSHGEAMSALDVKGVRTLTVYRPATAAAAALAPTSPTLAQRVGVSSSAPRPCPAPISEMQLWSCAVNGTTPPAQLTGRLPPTEHSADGKPLPMKLAAAVAPSGVLVAYTDAEAGLHMYNCRTGEDTLVQRGRSGVGTAFAWNKPYTGLAWTTDSEWLAFAARAPNTMQQARGAGFE